MQYRKIRKALCRSKCVSGSLCHFHKFYPWQFPNISDSIIQCTFWFPRLFGRFCWVFCCFSPLHFVRVEKHRGRPGSCRCQSWNDIVTRAPDPSTPWRRSGLWAEGGRLETPESTPPMISVLYRGLYYLAIWGLVNHHNDKQPQWKVKAGCFFGATLGRLDDIAG